MGEAAPSNPSPKSYYSMDCEYRAHAAIFLARQEAACDPFSALNLSVDKFHLRQHVQHQVLLPRLLPRIEVAAMPPKLRKSDSHSPGCILFTDGKALR